MRRNNSPLRLYFGVKGVFFVEKIVTLSELCANVFWYMQKVRYEIYITTYRPRF